MLPLIVIVVPILTYALIQHMIRSWQKPVNVSGKIAVVTGASSGLGEALAKRLARGGAKVVLCARNSTELNRVKNEISGDSNSQWPVVYQLDVSKPADIQAFVDDVSKKFGPVDILVNNAGVSQRGSVAETSLETHRNIMDINYFGPVELTNAVLPSMIKRREGHIVTISSVQGRISIPFRCAYAASKHAIQAFCDSLRAEVAKDNIRVTVVSPGYIRTNLSRNALSGDGSRHGVLDATTAAGMLPSVVADLVYDAVIYPSSELILADIKSNVAIYLRTILPSLYFKLMAWRAESERRKSVKT